MSELASPIASSSSIAVCIMLLALDRAACCMHGEINNSVVPASSVTAVNIHGCGVTERVRDRNMQLLVS